MATIMLPPYSYVPGLTPHPTSDPKGHSFGVDPPAAAPLEEASFGGNPTYLHAIELFHHGFYWEAHEAWEALWHAAGRSGATADFLKGLIKLAAAGVKLREGRAAGVRLHARRARELFRAAGQGRDQLFGLRLDQLLSAANKTEEQADSLAASSQPDASRRLPVTLRLMD